jgi:hypothetical protein
VKTDPTARKLISQLINRTAKRWDMSAQELLAIIKDVYGKA